MLILKMAVRMLLNVCKEVCKVPKCAQHASNLPRVNLKLTCPSLSSRLYSYCQSTGTEPDKLYKTLEIEVKGHDRMVLKSYQKFVQMAANELDVTISKIWEPPKAVIKRWTLLKSVHIYAKHKVQYETRTNYQTIEIKNITGSTADTFLEYLQRNLPEGMAMKVTRHAIEALPEYLVPPAASSSSPGSKEVKSQTSTS